MTETTDSSNSPTVLGRWYCRFIEQEQSDDEADEFGEYDDGGFDGGPTKASKTDYAGVTLEFKDDGTYRVESEEDWQISFGAWTHAADRLQLTEHDACTNGYDGLEYASLRSDGIVVAFKLVPDAHDGLDVMALTFMREPEPVKAKAEDGIVGQILAAEEEDEVYDAIEQAIDEQERDPADVARDLWDAVVDGRLAADGDSEDHDLHVCALANESLTESEGGFTHDHALYCLRNVDYEDRRDLADLAIDMIATLPAGPRDAELAGLLPEPWLQRMVSSRFLGGGTPEAFYGRALMPQPQADDASRAYILRSYFTRFEAFETLFPVGHADTATAVVRYRGPGVLDVPLTLIRARGLVAQAHAVALGYLEDHANVRRGSLWQSACLLGVMLSLELGQPLPDPVLRALELEPQGMTMGGMKAEEKATVREAIAGLSQAQRELVTRRFFLDR